MKTLLTIITFSLLLLSDYTRAELEVDEPLSFGTFAIAHNSSVSTISISANDIASSSNAIYILNPGRAAQLRLVNYPPFTRLSISAVLPVPSTVFVGITEQFILTQVDMPDSVVTDSLGEASLSLGGTLESSGNGGTYLETNYNFSLLLNINF